MKNIQSIPVILGKKLKEERMKKALDIPHVARHCCLSKNMVVELEDGHGNYFYTPHIKLSAAKKVGTFLGLDHQLFLDFGSDQADHYLIQDKLNHHKRT